MQTKKIKVMVFKITDIKLENNDPDIDELTVRLYDVPANCNQNDLGAAICHILEDSLNKTVTHFIYTPYENETEGIHGAIQNLNRSSFNTTLLTKNNTNNQNSIKADHRRNDKMTDEQLQKLEIYQSIADQYIDEHCEWDGVEETVKHLFYHFGVKSNELIHLLNFDHNDVLDAFDHEILLGYNMLEYIQTLTHDDEEFEKNVLPNLGFSATTSNNIVNGNQIDPIEIIDNFDHLVNEIQMAVHDETKIISVFEILGFNIEDLENNEIC